MKNKYFSVILCFLLSICLPSILVAEEKKSTGPGISIAEEKKAPGSAISAAEQKKAAGSAISAAEQKKAAGSAISAAEKKKGTGPVILIQTASELSIEKDKANNALFKVTLHKVTPYLSYLTDRPNREVGKLTLDKYLALWESDNKNSFKNDPPNAIIHVNHGEGEASKSPNYYTVVLGKPKYDSAAQTLAYQAKSLSAASENTKLPDSAKFKHATIIIDDICIGCW